MDDKRGDAARIEIKHESKDLKAQAYVGRTDVGFDEPGRLPRAGPQRSRRQARVQAFATRRTIRGEALRTEDVATSSTRDGLALMVQHQLAERLTFELGVRHAAEKGVTSPFRRCSRPTAAPCSRSRCPTPSPRCARASTGAIPQVPGLSIYGEAEVDVRETDRRILAAGAEYQLANKGRIYARHEFVSSITGPYGLNETERQNTTAVGVDTEYMKDGKLFSEYRIRDAIAGGDAEAAVGLRNLW